MNLRWYSILGDGVVVCGNGFFNGGLDVPAVIRECELMVNFFRR